MRRQLAILCAVLTLAGCTPEDEADVKAAVSANAAPPATAAAPAGKEFCAGFNDVQTWSKENFPKLKTGPWAAGMVQRLTALQPAAPGDLAPHLAAVIAGYRKVADGGSLVGLAGSDLPDRIETIDVACGSHDG
ncbi:hypothetical protein [Catellatospora vulcania]|uniref:hypothetical protein n=1 Tax=Catellatospora vulcania TaxID=1460450 RepID=UPI0012D40217|nr:hypothetical protein [Catellatospora vulcania]